MNSCIVFNMFSKHVYYFELVWYYFNLIEFSLRGILMNAMHSDIYCTTSSTNRSKLPKRSVSGDTSQEVSSSIYILALRHHFQRVTERMSTSCLNSLLRRYWRLRALYMCIRKSL
jgi:hypothetical protein